MHLFSRQLGLTLSLFLIWLAAAWCAQLWLRTESMRIQTEAVAKKGIQMETALALRLPSTGAWDESAKSDLETLLDGTLAIGTSIGQNEEQPSGMLYLDQPLPGNATERVRLTFRTPGSGRLALLHERMITAIGLLALLFVLVTIMGAVLRRSAETPAEEQRLPEARAEMNALEHLARVSVESSNALATESGARRRAEENLELSRTLLDLSVEDRIRLGRDLHDNLCQTLYAVSLNLEGVRKRLRQQPAQAEQNLTTCMEELRAANREVRAWIAGLSPDAVRRETFIDSLHGMLGSLGNLAGIQFEPRIDTEAAGLLTPEQATEALRIIREAISNAVRHGGARTIVVHVRRDEKEVVLAVQDNGSGFDLQTKAGHGLENMRARADTAGGKLRIASTPGAGARVALTLPILTA